MFSSSAIDLWIWKWKTANTWRTSSRWRQPHRNKLFCVPSAGGAVKFKMNKSLGATVTDNGWRNCNPFRKASQLHLRNEMRYAFHFSSKPRKTKLFFLLQFHVATCQNSFNCFISALRRGSLGNVCLLIRAFATERKAKTNSKFMLSVLGES